MNMPQKWTSPLAILEDLENFAWPLSLASANQSLSIYETENEVVVEAPMPGLNENNIEVTFEKGTLILRGKREDTEEDKKRRYFHRANRSFVYQISIPDEMQEPRAEFKDGIAKVIFQRKKKAEVKRIPVTKAK